MSSIIKKDGFSYTFDTSACATCGGRCCTGESGYIYVDKKEIESISTFLNMQVDEFMSKYLYKKGYKYSLNERRVGDSYECIFYDSTLNGCSIYDVRPLQCSTFPFWDYFKRRITELKLECPGVVVGSDND